MTKKTVNVYVVVGFNAAGVPAAYAHTNKGTAASVKRSQFPLAKGRVSKIKKVAVEVPVK